MRMRWLIPVVLVAVLVIGVVIFRSKSAKEKEAAEQSRQVRDEPQVAQQRALAEARTVLNAELIPDDGTFFPATGDIEVGSLLYTLHLLGPAKQRYYSEDAFLAGRAGDLFIVRPILDRARPAGAAPESYRGRQSRSAETKRQEVKAQKKITLAELTRDYAARTSP
jgi:hypothetical protein